MDSNIKKGSDLYAYNLMKSYGDKGSHYRKIQEDYKIMRQKAREAGKLKKEKE